MNPSSPSGVSKTDLDALLGAMYDAGLEYAAACEKAAHDLAGPVEKHARTEARGDFAVAYRELRASLSSETATEAPVFLTIGRGGDRVYCVGCKAWQQSEGYCEGDPDICPIGEEDQGRSPSLAEAQHAIDLLAAELREIDDSGAEQIRVLQAEVAQLRSRLASSPPVPAEAPNEDTKRLDWLEDRIVEACGESFDLYRATDKGDSMIRVETWGAAELRQIIAAARSTPTEATND